MTQLHPTVEIVQQWWSCICDRFGTAAKERALCDFIVARHVTNGKPVAARPDQICKSMWPDVPQSRAEHSFNTTKSALRKRLLGLYKNVRDLEAPFLFVTESNSLAYLFSFLTSQISLSIARQHHLSPALLKDWSALRGSIDDSLDERGRLGLIPSLSDIDRVIDALKSDLKGTKVARDLQALRELLTVLTPQLCADVSVAPRLGTESESQEKAEKQLFENVIQGLPDFFKIGLFFIETQKYSPDAASRLMGMPLGEVVEIMRDGYETAVKRTVQQLAVLQSTKPL